MGRQSLAPSRGQPSLALICSSSAWRGHLVPQPAIQVDVIAVGLTGSGISDVSVEGMPAIGGLRLATCAFDRAQYSDDARAGGWSPNHRPPIHGTAPVARGLGRGNEDKPVKGVAPGVRQN